MRLSFIASFLIPIFILILSFVTSETIYGQNTVWEKPFVGNDPSLLYYPDQNAVYVRHAWENKKGKGILIKGKMPDSRYFSFNLYNDYTKSSIASLADYEIKPDAGDSTGYTIYIMPEGTTGTYQNIIILPDSVKIASVFLRYYLARGDNYANKPLPLISMLYEGISNSPLPSIPQPSMTQEDMAKLKRQIMANPKLISGKERKVLSSSSSTFAEKEPIICKAMTMSIFSHFTNPESISAYRFDPGGNYPNKDNFYIIMPVVRKRNDLLIVRFKPPGFSNKLGDTTQNVRYFSISQGNEYTNTSITMHDEQLRVSNDGFIYVVVANDEQATRTKVNEMGINFMPWLNKDKLVLILRHMLPSPAFKKSIREVPLFDKGFAALGQEAQLAIGEYALTGKFFKNSEWKSISRYTQLEF